MFDLFSGIVYRYDDMDAVAPVAIFLFFFVTEKPKNGL